MALWIGITLLIAVLGVSGYIAMRVVRFNGKSADLGHVSASWLIEQRAAQDERYR